LSSSSLEEPEKEGIGVGIDLGTTYSAIAYLQDGGVPTIIPIPDNGRTMPSVVAFLTDDGNNERTVLTGRPACEKELELGGAYRNVKRVLGTGGKLPSDIAEVVPFLKASTTGKTYKKDSLLNRLHDAEHHPTLLFKTPGLLSDDRGDDDTIRPEEISSQILKTLKETAENHTGQTVTRAVIGVPAYFNDAQRAATVKSAELAGISKVKLLREPEAAALAYGIGKEQIGMGDEDELVLVFDLGGGTYDVSMLLVGGGMTEIISTTGNAQLGGSVFDARIAQYFFKLIREVGGVASTKNWSEKAKNAVILAAEAVRIYLSNNRRANLMLPVSEDTWNDMSDAKNVILPMDCTETPFTSEQPAFNSTHVLVRFSRKDMEGLCKHEFQALLRPLREVAIMSGALLPGDSSPTIVDAALALEEEEQAARELASFEEFYKEVDEAEDGDSPTSDEEDIESSLLLELQDIDMREAKKAQQRGRKRSRSVAKQERKYRQEKRKINANGKKSESTTGDAKNVKVLDGISGRPINRVVLVGGATRMPGVGRLLSALTGVVAVKTVNPDEAVALGCAVQVGVLDGMEEMGTVLNPLQAAILRAMAEKEGTLDDDDFDD
jgi:molecular chaperone DnaK (HSP70)